MFFNFRNAMNRSSTKMGWSLQSRFCPIPNSQSMEVSYIVYLVLNFQIYCNMCTPVFTLNTSILREKFECEIVLWWDKSNVENLNVFGAWWKRVMSRYIRFSFRDCSLWTELLIVVGQCGGNILFLSPMYCCCRNISNERPYAQLSGKEGRGVRFCKTGAA